MKAPSEGLEIVIKAKPGGDWTVEANSRDNYRVVHALRCVLKSMDMELNRLKGRLILPNSHADQFGHFERMN